MTISLLFRVPEDLGRLYERILYPAGELQVRLLPGTVEALYRADKVQVLCRTAHLNLMELALISDAIHNLTGFTRTELVLPYLPYSRADRRFTEGDCHGLKTFGEIVDGLRFNVVRTLDVHSFRAQKCISNLVNTSPKPFIERALADIMNQSREGVAVKEQEGCAVLLPDAGAARYQLQGAIQCIKKRDPVTGKLSGFQVPHFLGPALIVDDICDGGGTFIGLAETIFEQNGPTRLFLYVTHGLFSKGLQVGSGLLNYFSRVYTTDSICADSMFESVGKNLEVYGCEPALLD